MCADCCGKAYNLCQSLKDNVGIATQHFIPSCPKSLACVAIGTTFHFTHNHGIFKGPKNSDFTKRINGQVSRTFHSIITSALPSYN